MNTNVLNSAGLLAGALALSVSLAHADIPVNQNYFGNSPYTQAPQAIPQAVPPQAVTPQVTGPARIDVDDIDDMNTVGSGNAPAAAPVNSNWTPAPVQPYMAPSAPNTPQGGTAWPPQTTSIPTASMMPNAPAIQTAPNGLRIAFQTPFNSETAQDGDNFMATATDDFWMDNKLMVPKGSVLRGRIAVTKKAGLISKSQEIVLNFDHMTMPDGTLKPLNYQMAPTTTNSTAKAISGEDRFAYGMQRAGRSITDGADRGVEVARAKGGFFNYLLAVPAYTLKGVASGTLITTSTATKAIFGHKNDSIMVQPGDVFVIDPGEAAQLLYR